MFKKSIIFNRLSTLVSKMDLTDCANLNTQKTHKLHNLKFDNKILRILPVDSVTENYVRTVNNAVAIFDSFSYLVF